MVLPSTCPTREPRPHLRGRMTAPKHQTPNSSLYTRHTFIHHHQYMFTVSN